jgi:hypothetical protein
MARVWIWFYPSLEEKMTNKLLLIFALLASVALACTFQLPCPIHDHETAHFTGKTAFVEGAFVGYYRCPRGHEFMAKCD